MGSTMAGQAKDDDAIRSVVHAYADAWNRHDMDAWGMLFIGRWLIRAVQNTLIEPAGR